MICINCFHDKTQVTNSRQHRKHPVVWRRRHCERCQTVFTSYERPTLKDQPVYSVDGHKSTFNLGKLIVSIARSFHHNKQAADFYSLDLATTVQEKLLTQGKPLSSDDIAATVHNTLKKFDQLAALQYAAQHDLLTLKKRPGRPASYRSLPSDQPRRS